MRSAGPMPAAPAATTDWVLPPFFMLRVAGLPIDTVAPLRAPETVRWCERLLTMESDLDGPKQAVADALGEAVAGTDDVDLRRRLLNLRRDVFNRRLPRNLASARELAAHLDDGPAAELCRWLALRERYAKELSAGEAILAEETRAGRGGLRRLAEDPRLRLGLLLASPSLDRYLPTYLKAADGKLSKRARRIERSLLEYVFRTACKTSPFSTLTTIGLGRFTQTPNGVVGVDRLGLSQRSFARLNIVALARLTELVVNDLTLRQDLPVELTSGWRTDDDRIRYVRRQHRLGDDDNAMTMDLLEEDLFYLSGGRLLNDLLATMPTEGRPVRFGDLVDRLHGDDPENRRREDVESYLSRLLRLGLLTVPMLRIDIHHPDPLRDLHDRLSGLGRPWSDKLARRLEAIMVHLTAFPGVDLPRRRQLLGQIQTELEGAQRDLDRTDVATPRTLVYEDVTLGTSRVTADRRRWERDLVPALERLCRILPVFDMNLPDRLVTKGFFRARYGVGGGHDDVIKFAHEFRQDCHEEYVKASMARRPFDEDGGYVPQQNWFGQPEIAALDAARVEVVRRMRELSEGLTPDAPEVVLDDDFVEGVAERLSGVVSSLSPRSFFLQVADAGNGPVAVLNRIYSGLTLLFSRFAHCFPDGDGHHGLVSGLRDTLRRLQPPGTVFAELTGGLETTNLNLHPSVMLYELVCPGDASSRPVAEQIPADDLTVVDDTVTDELILWSRRLGVRVIPVYLGFLLPMALPELQRILLTFSYANMAPLDLWGGVPNPTSPGALETRPRVRYRDLVLQRRTWRLPDSGLPDRATADADATWFLDWNRFARRHSLPRRVFLSQDASAPSQDAQDDSERDDSENAQAPLSKPQYIDFDSFFSLILLDKAVKSGNRGLVLTEMLPDLNELWLCSEEGSHVAELTVELDGVAKSSAPHVEVTGSNR